MLRAKCNKPAPSPIGTDECAPSRRASRSWTWLGALTWLGCGALYLTLPPSPDQFNHAYLGWRWLEGGVPYRDAIDMNWPGVMFLHALATGIFGVHVWSWRAFDYLAFGVTCMFLCGLVRRAAGTHASRICAISSPVFYVTSGYWLAGQHDMTAAQFLVAALWAHVRGGEERTRRWQLLAGVLLGTAMLNKPTVGVMLPLLALHALVLGAPARRVAGNMAVVTAGLLAALGAAAAAVMATGATGQEILDATIVYNAAAQYVALPEVLSSKPRSVVADFVWLHGRRWADLALAAVPALIWLAKPLNRSPAGMALWVLWLTGVLSYFLQARGFAYHLAPAYLALLALFPVALGLLGKARPNPRASPPALRTVALGLLLCASAVLLVARLNASYGALPRALWTGDSSVHQANFKANDGISVADAAALARLVRTTPASDCFLLVGSGSATNYLAERAQPTRFYYFPIIAQAAPPLPMAQAWQELWATELRSARCYYVAVNRHILEKWTNDGGVRAQALMDLLASYELTGGIGADGGLLLYRRRDR